MRTDNSLKNTVVSLFSLMITMLVGFFAQGIFLKILGTEYLGINGLFSNIISMLSLVELGIGPAIVYNLYKPIADGDKEKIKSLILFYKKSYRVIAAIIGIVGILILPFLSTITGEVNIDYNIHFIFVLFIIEIICSYLLTYKSSILYANQKNYVVSFVHLVCVVVLNALQIFILFKTRNYVLYLIAKIFMRIVENIAITIMANRMYPYIMDKDVVPLDKSVTCDIVTKVKGLIFHKIGAFFVRGTDNILMSSFIGISYVGLYSNYLMILNAVSTIFSQIFTSIVASVGNLLVTEDSGKSFEVYKKVNWLNFVTSVFGVTCLICLLQPFITLWIGVEYTFPFVVVVSIVVNFYFTLMRMSINTFKDAAGIYHEDRFIPLFESFINIVASIVFIKLFGLIGIFLGTIASSLLLFFYSYPKYVYKRLFKRNCKEYIFKFVKQFVLACFIATFTYFVTSLNTISNPYFAFVLNMIICVVVPNFIMFLIYHNSEEFKYFWNLIVDIKNKFIKIKK